MSGLLSQGVNWLDTVNTNNSELKKAVKNLKQAAAELGQTQVKIEVTDDVVVEVRN